MGCPARKAGVTEVLVKPLVSIVMSVHNGEEHIACAMDSLFKQTLQDFEIIVVDDGSQDQTGEILSSYDDPRIRLLTNETNKGLAWSLNLGIAQARGVFVARMDHDDISLPRRLEVQVDFLESNEDVDCCGTWSQLFGGSSHNVWRVPCDSEDVRMQLLFDSPLVHSSVMFRRGTFLSYNLHYDTSFPCAQDYDLWERASCNIKLANIGEVLLYSRQHSSQVGQVKKRLQLECADKVRRRALDRLGVETNADNLWAHSVIATGSQEPSAQMLRDASNWLAYLLSVNGSTQIYDPDRFSAFIGKKWRGLCTASSHLGLVSYRICQEAGLVCMKTSQRASFLGRCLLAELKRTLCARLPK